MPVGTPLQILFADPEYPAVGTHPKIPLAIIRDMADHIVGQSLARGDGCEAPLFQAAQTAAEGSHPERAVFLGQQRPNKVAGQSIRLVELRDLPLLQPAQSPA